jgi:hypothetical protein
MKEAAPEITVKMDRKHDNCTKNMLKSDLKIVLCSYKLNSETDKLHAKTGFCVNYEVFLSVFINLLLQK